MKRRFNVTGICNPQEHYMVNLDDRVEKIKEEYEEDRYTGMDVRVVAEQVYVYTSGYPVLVSFLCKCMDEELVNVDGFEEPESALSAAGVEKAGM